MCTLTFYKKGAKVIITSNRDESIDRPPASQIQIQNINGRNLYFPKDPKAGGTWFVVNEIGDTFVILNGAKSKHISDPPYRKSRGVILIELASSIDFELEWKKIDLTKIEPFTLIAYKKNRLIQVRWSGKNKESTILNESEPHIWSSSTLYESRVIEQREIWYANFIKKFNNSITKENLIYFHTNTQIFDFKSGILIKRYGEIFTKNITQFELQENYFELLHIDLITNIINIIKEDIL